MPDDPNYQLFADRIREIGDVVQEISDKLPAAQSGDHEFSPRTRFGITIVAQIGGYILLRILGTNIFKVDQDNIRTGLFYILKIENYYIAGSFLIPIAIFLVTLAIRRRFFKYHIYTDILLMSYVIFDLALLLFLVCQEGGLCRSMFLPVYFLIPTAYLIAERHNKKYRVRRLLVLAGIMICILISFQFAVWLTPADVAGVSGPAQGTFMFLSLKRFPVQITDFSALAHPRYVYAVLWASIISASVPFVQIVVGMCVDRYKKLT